tara:strand:+ start:1138 stop:1749 length:612 start_codon:yes stop_codon:yes gene_type:complete
MNKSYYWGEPDISVKFCEPKYQDSNWIAEYENTTSAIAYIIVGSLLLPFNRLSKIGFYIILLGISTMIMHGTLRYYGQWLDESSMLLLSFETIVQLKNTVPRYLFPIILAFYTYFRENFMIFGFLFAAFQIVIVYLANKKIDFDDWRQKLLIRTYVVIFLISFGFWLADQLFCDNIFYLVNGHAVWHIGTALGMFFGFMTFLI